MEGSSRGEEGRYHRRLALVHIPGPRSEAEGGVGDKSELRVRAVAGWGADIHVFFFRFVHIAVGSADQLLNPPGFYSGGLSWPTPGLRTCTEFFFY